MPVLDVHYLVIPRERTVEVRTETLSTDSLGPGDILIATQASMISAGTELANYTGEDPGVHQPGNYNTYPYRPGYGNVGRVLATGPEVQGVAAGDAVFSFGKHASHIVRNPARQPLWEAAFPLPPDLPAVEVAVLRMGLIAYTAPQQAPAEPGGTVAVFGLGLVGNLAAQLYRLAGARVIGLDPMPERCALARQCGIETVLNVPPAEQVAALLDLTAGKGASITVEAVGHSASVINALSACADYGQVVLLGSPRAPHSTDVTPAFRHIHLRWLTVRGALEWCLPPQPTPGGKHSIAGNLQRLISFMGAGQLQVRPLISHVIRPAALGAAYEGLLGEKQLYWGVVIDWS
jgi:2-desacetyl-2-hydroxyethyl bacteriochlorophyllide A dehydrogenase